jgi:hypothetical protein
MMSTARIWRAVYPAFARSDPIELRRGKPSFARVQLRASAGAPSLDTIQERAGGLALSATDEPALGRLQNRAMTGKTRATAAGLGRGRPS